MTAAVAFQTSLADGGWPIEWADIPVATVIGRRLNELLLRAVRPGG